MNLSEYGRRSMTLRDQRSAYVSMRKVDVMFTSSRVAPQVDLSCPSSFSNLLGQFFIVPNIRKGDLCYDYRKNYPL